MELAEFIAKIVLDAFEGLNEALRLQQEKHVEMVAAAALDAAHFARLAISEEDLDRELARLFPGSDPNILHNVYVGAPYQPELEEGNVESPPFRSLVGIQLERADYVRSRRTKGFGLSKTAVNKIRTAVHVQLGLQSQNILRSTLNRGVPHVIIDSGSVSARLALTLEPTKQTSSGPTTVVRGKNARLLVRMVDDRAPQNQQLRVDSLSELEIKFKTVT